MISESNIEYLHNSYRDPVGRCFVAQNRFFRAINPEYKGETLLFLQSNLCHELIKRRWLIDTWVADDVDIHGYDLILEHRMVQAYPWQYLSFEQLRDAACLHVDIETLCNQYGYHIKDAGFNNIGLDNGNPIFLDFGSFSKGREKGEGFMREYSIMYKRLLDMANLNYQTARALEPRQYVHDVIDGGGVIIYSSEYLKKIYPMVEYYAIHRKVSKTPLFYTWSRLSMSCLDGINCLARKILKKRTSWRLLTAIPEYKALSKMNMLALHVNYEYDPQISIVDSDVLSNVQRLLKTHEQVKALFLVGNYTIESYRIVHSIFNGGVYLCTKEPSIADRVYLESKEQRETFNVLCGDARMLQDFVEKYQLSENSLYIVSPANKNDFDAEIRNKEIVIYTQK